jgi:hypothetical protein
MAYASMLTLLVLGAVLTPLYFLYFEDILIEANPKYWEWKQRRVARQEAEESETGLQTKTARLPASNAQPEPETEEQSTNNPLASQESTGNQELI